MKNKAISIAVNVARLLLAVTFVLSGFVKLVDPLGTQYKLHDYLDAMHLAAYAPDMLLLVASVALSTLEFCFGLALLFAIHRRLVSKVVLLFMAVMTGLTVWIAVANPVSDCGCFGDAIVLSNTQTLLKNIVLLVCAVIVAWKPLKMGRFVSESNQWIVVNYSVIFALVVALLSLYYLPLYDFRPYKIGTDIKAAMEIPEDAEQPEFETTFIMEKDGVQKEFSLEDYPDSTWTFIDSKTVQVSQGYVPPIHDFSIETIAMAPRQSEGDDITDEVLSHEGYTFLLISPHLSNADDSQLDLINQLHEYSREFDYPFYCLTASGKTEIMQWNDRTGAEYPYCATDEITLKTIIRSNPGLLLLKDGKIIQKWSHNELPDEYTLAGKPLDQLEIGQMREDSAMKRTTLIMLWFVLPLMLLVFADRLWAWTSIVRLKKKKKNVNEDENEDENEDVNENEDEDENGNED